MTFDGVSRLMLRDRLLLPVIVLLAGAVMPSFHTAHANGLHGRSSTEEPPTRLERFLLDGCSPCTRETYPVTTLAISPLTFTAHPRIPSTHLARHGEISVDVLRVYQLGWPSRQTLALRMTLSVSTGSGAELFRLAAGIVDDEEVIALGAAIADMAVAVTTQPETGGEVEIEFHTGTLRIGVMRTRGESLSYIQAGDISILTLRPTWQTPTTLYLSVADMTLLSNAVGQAASKIQALRSGR
jgi:hypothetical protein